MVKRKIYGLRAEQVSQSHKGKDTSFKHQSIEQLLLKCTLKTVD